MIQHASLSTEASCDILVSRLCVCVCLRACALQFFSGFVPSFQILNHLTDPRGTQYEYYVTVGNANDINFNFIHSVRRKARNIKSERTPAPLSLYWVSDVTYDNRPLKKMQLLWTKCRSESQFPAQIWLKNSSSVVRTPDCKKRLRGTSSHLLNEYRRMLSRSKAVRSCADPRQLLRKLRKGGATTRIAHLLSMRENLMISFNPARICLLISDERSDTITKLLTFLTTGPDMFLKTYSPIELKRWCKEAKVKCSRYRPGCGPECGYSFSCSLPWPRH
jgi:hypothetical protein